MNEDVQFILDSATESMDNALKHLEKQLVNIIGDFIDTEDKMIELKGADYTLGYALGVLKQIKRILQFDSDE